MLVALLVLGCCSLLVMQTAPKVGAAPLGAWAGDDAWGYGDGAVDKRQLSPANTLMRMLNNYGATYRQLPKYDRRSPT